MKKILIIKANFYEQIAKELQESAVIELEKENLQYDVIDVPGVFEIPTALSMAISSDKYNGFVTLGCVIRGETTHYDYVCEESARGINKLAIKHNAAVGFGIITAENQQQAKARSDKNNKDVGGKSAKAAIEMIKIRDKLNNV